MCEVNMGGGVWKRNAKNVKGFSQCLYRLLWNKLVRYGYCWNSMSKAKGWGGIKCSM